MADAIGQHALYPAREPDGRVLYGTVTSGRMKKESSNKNWSSIFTWKKSKGKEASPPSIC